MAHYAFLDENNVVTEVIVGKDEGSDTDWEAYYAEVRGMKCLRTSYNTRAGINTRTGEPGFRGNYAGIGDIYREYLDAFIPPQTSPDAVLDETTFTWVVVDVA